MATVDARVPRQFPTAPSGSSGSNGRAAPTIAERADALAVYEDAVQEPALECGNLASLYYNAQDLGSRRPEARVLREDFCSSAIVAQTWVGLDEGHRRAQGVDVDLRALEVARRRATRPGRTHGQASRVILLQSGQYGDGHKARVVEAEEQHEAVVKREGEQQEQEEQQQQQQKESKPEEETTWSVGATTDRFERRFQARLRRQQEQAAKEKARESLTNAEEDDLSATPALTLMHADVLSLPLPLPLDVRPVAAPDIVYAGNYALSYFHTRPLLIAYLAQVARTLRRGTGCLIVDPFAGPTSWSSSATEQAALWSVFSAEPGFLRGPGDPPMPVPDDAALQFWSAPPSQADGGAADWRRWPRGNLVKVRQGALFGGYDYYREDSPLDHASNRFRMSLSFRFRGDGSWLRDYFSYDFRAWSIMEIKEAMYEVGLRHVEVHAIERADENADDDHDDDNDAVPRSPTDDDDDIEGDFALLGRTERSETGKKSFRHLKPDDSEKLFATRSFGTYIVARAPE